MTAQEAEQRLAKYHRESGLTYTLWASKDGIDWMIVQGDETRKPEGGWRVWR